MREQFALNVRAVVASLRADGMAALLRVCARPTACSRAKKPARFFAIFKQAMAGLRPWVHQTPQLAAKKGASVAIFICK